jgi:hypothetical protein
MCPFTPLLFLKNSRSLKTMTASAHHADLTQHIDDSSIDYNPVMG